MKSMTYGVLPTREEFDVAFGRECPSGWYRIRLSVSDAVALEHFKLGDGDINASWLWECLLEIKLDWERAEESSGPNQADCRMGIVSGIMTTLGFEWV